jgi:hypothetical protein
MPVDEFRIQPRKRDGRGKERKRKYHLPVAETRLKLSIIISNLLSLLFTQQYFERGNVKQKPQPIYLLYKRLLCLINQEIREVKRASKERFPSLYYSLSLTLKYLNRHLQIFKSWIYKIISYLKIHHY